MKQVFADTVYWLALLNLRDELHAEASRLAKTLESLQIVTTDWVLLEVLNGLAAYGPLLRGTAARFVLSLIAETGADIVPHTIEDFAHALALYQDRPDKAWSMTDRSSFLLMQKIGIDSALTCDKHFEQAGFKALLR